MIDLDGMIISLRLSKVLIGKKKKKKEHFVILIEVSIHLSKCNSGHISKHHNNIVTIKHRP